MKNINAAYRVRKILREAQKSRDQEKTHVVWNQALNLNEAESQRARFLISRCLADLHEEVESIKRGMEGTGFSSNLYLPTLSRCNSIFAVQHLEGSWQGIKAQISSEVLTVLGFCSEILPDEESEVDPVMLAELADIVRQMREILSAADLNMGLRKIVEKHADKIEEALDKYQAVGAKAFDDALQSAIGEVVINDAELKREQGSPAYNKLKEMWHKLQDVVVSASAANSHVDSAISLAGKVQKLIKLMDGI